MGLCRASKDKDLPPLWSTPVELHGEAVTAEKLEAPKTEIYGQIEAILAELPEDMGVKARWAAGKMLAEMFAEYLKMRLRLEDEGGTA